MFIFCDFSGPIHRVVRRLLPRDTNPNFVTEYLPLLSYSSHSWRGLTDVLLFLIERMDLKIKKEKEGTCRHIRRTQAASRVRSTRHTRPYCWLSTDRMSIPVGMSNEGRKTLEIALRHVHFTKVPQFRSFYFKLVGYPSSSAESLTSCTVVNQAILQPPPPFSGYPPPSLKIQMNVHFRERENKWFLPFMQTLLSMEISKFREELVSFRIRLPLNSVEYPPPHLCNL